MGALFEKWGKNPGIFGKLSGEFGGKVVKLASGAADELLFRLVRQRLGKSLHNSQAILDFSAFLLIRPFKVPYKAL